MTRPVPGPTSPEPRGIGRDASSPDSKKFSETMKKVDAVEEVSETELDKQRKRPFYEAPPPEEEEESQCLGSSTDFGPLNPLPSPGTPFSQNPPDSSSQSQQSALPHSRDFWESNDLPDEPPQQTRFQEKQEAVKKKPDAKDSSEKKKKEAVLGPEIRIKKEEKEKKKELLASAPWQSPLPQGRSPKSEKESSKEKELKAKLKQSHTAPLPEEKKEPLREPKKETPFPYPASKEAEGKTSEKKEIRRIWDSEEKSSTPSKLPSKKEEAQKKREVRHAGTATNLIPDPLPPAVQSVAASAQISAAPYLSPETAALFSKLVGTIFFMTSATPGISRTEVVLNADTFRNSPFYNSKIILEKYASAPDAFNIRLIGSPEAVKAFDQNSNNLMTAFTAAYEDRKIQFRIGRLDISLNTDRPLFRRKESVGNEDGSLQ